MQKHDCVSKKFAWNHRTRRTTKQGLIGKLGTSWHERRDSGEKERKKAGTARWRWCIKCRWADCTNQKTHCTGRGSVEVEMKVGVRAIVQGC
eukprot:222549-Hanusia_phi.AAC.4